MTFFKLGVYRIADASGDVFWTVSEDPTCFAEVLRGLLNVQAPG